MLTSAALIAPRASRSAALWRFRQPRLHAVLGDEIDRPRLELGQDLADIFAHDADHDQLHAAEHHQADHDRRIARHGLAEEQRLDQDLHAEEQRGDRQQQAEQAGEPQRRDRERGQPLDRQADQRLAHSRCVRPCVALGRLVVDADLAEADPARQALEEAVALRHLPQRRGRARRQQAEVAGILRNFVARAPVEQRVERRARRAGAASGSFSRWALAV